MQDDEYYRGTNNMSEVSLPGGTETILIVDDEVDHVDIASFHLKSLGYNTINIYDSIKAFNIIHSDQKFDLILSDIIMPGKMNGFLLAREAFRQDPGAKVLLTSAYIKKNETRPVSQLD